MSEPIVLLTTHRINAGDLERLTEVNREWVEFVKAQPHSLASHLYYSEDGTEVTNVLVFADTEAAEFHLQTAGDRIHRALEIAETTKVQVYGAPGPVLQQVIHRNWDAGVQVTAMEGHAGGFTRDIPAVGVA